MSTVDVEATLAPLRELQSLLDRVAEMTLDAKEKALIQGKIDARDKRKYRTEYLASISGAIISMRSGIIQKLRDGLLPDEQLAITQQSLTKFFDGLRLDDEPVSWIEVAIFCCNRLLLDEAEVTKTGHEAYELVERAMYEGIKVVPISEVAHNENLDLIRETNRERKLRGSGECNTNIANRDNPAILSPRERNGTMHYYFATEHMAWLFLRTLKKSLDVVGKSCAVYNRAVEIASGKVTRTVAEVLLDGKSGSALLRGFFSPAKGEYGCEHAMLVNYSAESDTLKVEEVLAKDGEPFPDLAGCKGQEYKLFFDEKGLDARKLPHHLKRFVNFRFYEAREAREIRKRQEAEAAAANGEPIPVEASVSENGNDKTHQRIDFEPRTPRGKRRDEHERGGGNARRYDE